MKYIEISKSSHDFDFFSFSSDEFKLKVIAQLNEKNRFKYIWRTYIHPLRVVLVFTKFSLGLMLKFL